jgi:hypothetical protein
LDIPLDASPKYRQRCERLKAAIAKHGTLNSYFLHNARCVFHVVNHDRVGAITYRFEGTVLTDAADMHCQQCDLIVELVGETCDWLTEPVAHWFAETVSHAVVAEFDRYVQAGDLEKTHKRLEEIESRADEAGGFVGMYL